MRKQFLRWLLDNTAQAVFAAVIGSASITAVVNAVVRQIVIPSWEWAWVIWTGTAFVSYVTLIKIAPRWLPAHDPYDRQHRQWMKFDQDAPRRFSPKDISDLFTVIEDNRKPRRVRQALLQPHVGLWLKASGRITEIIDEAGAGGAKGEWASVFIDLPVAAGRWPRTVTLWFRGYDAGVLRAMNEGDEIQAIGRIHEIGGVSMSITLLPAELSTEAPRP